MELALVSGDEDRTDLVVPESTAERIRDILDAGTATETKRALTGDLGYFWTWAEIALGLQEAYPVPPAAVLEFITQHLTGLPERVDTELVRLGVKARPGPHSIATVSRRVSSLSSAHRVKGVFNPGTLPEVKTLLSKARKAAAKAGKTQKRMRAATRDILEMMLDTCDGSMAGIRDRALLLAGFSSGGRRRSELAGMCVEHLTEVDDGFVWELPLSKTDQEGEGLVVPVVGKAGIALAAWIRAAEVESGPVFRGLSRAGKVLKPLSDKAVNRVVKRRAELAGLDPEQYGGHSLRSGFITQCGRQNVALGNGMALSGHKTVAVAMRYHQAGQATRNPAGRLMDDPEDDG